MKKILTFIRHFFSKAHTHTKQPLNTDILANLELALAFNHAINITFKHKTGGIASFIATIISITERQVVVKDVTSHQIRIILLTKLQQVSFVPEQSHTTPIDKLNA